jgi:hypothetical protein
VLAGKLLNFTGNLKEEPDYTLAPEFPPPVSTTLSRNFASPFVSCSSTSTSTFQLSALEGNPIEPYISRCAVDFLLVVRLKEKLNFATAGGLISA